MIFGLGGMLLLSPRFRSQLLFVASRQLLMMYHHYTDDSSDSRQRSIHNEHYPETIRVAIEDSGCGSRGDAEGLQRCRGGVGGARTEDSRVVNDFIDGA